MLLSAFAHQAPLTGLRSCRQVHTQVHTRRLCKCKLPRKKDTGDLLILQWSEAFKNRLHRSVLAGLGKRLGDHGLAEGPLE